ncbi:hypothetical protein [Schlesneria paludicola]|uniref:hypothetical protein n=1 Tax=Schlesneria paludicola TaxID=360056 RepID=UPI00029AAA3E|nr:hypothetical protein [Schlesneria paludicola]
MESRQTNPSAGREVGAGTVRAHRSASPLGRASEGGGASSEQWYFRIDGREYGPTSRDQLEKFLAPPRLCKSLEVMCSIREGYWSLIANDVTVEMVLERFGIEVESDRPAEPSKPVQVGQASVIPVSKATVGPSKPVYRAPNPIVEWFRDTWEWVGERLAKYMLVILVVLGIVALNLGMTYFFADPVARELEIVARYESLWNSALKLGGDEASSEEWRAFADQAEAELDPLIKEVARAASVQNQVRQKLLFLGRDHLKPLFAAKGPPTKNSSSAQAVSRYFKLLRDQLPKTGR